MKMLHVTIQTNKFEEELQFFMEHVGLVMQKDLRPMGRKIVFLANTSVETSIEIIEKADADNSGNPNLSIGFQAEDLEKKLEELMTAGYEVTPMISPMPGVQFFFVKDPAGVSIQFM